MKRAGSHPMRARILEPDLWGTWLWEAVAPHAGAHIGAPPTAEAYYNTMSHPMRARILEQTRKILWRYPKGIQCSRYGCHERIANMSTCLGRWASANEMAPRALVLASAVVAGASPPAATRLGPSSGAASAI